MLILVWIGLIILFLACLAYGAWYAFTHGMSALTTVSHTGGEVAQVLDRLNEPNSAADKEDRTPFFVRPLSDVSDRYTKTREEIEKRHIKRHERHQDAWEKWHNYRENDLNSLADEIETTAQSSDAKAS